MYTSLGINDIKNKNMIIYIVFVVNNFSITSSTFLKNIILEKLSLSKSLISRKAITNNIITVKKSNPMDNAQIAKLWFSITNFLKCEYTKKTREIPPDVALVFIENKLSCLNGKPKNNKKNRIQNKLRKCSFLTMSAIVD